VIIELSPEAEALGWSKGDRVAYSTLQTCSEVSTVPASALLKVPDGLSLELACAFVVQGLTAHHLVADAHPSSRRWYWSISSTNGQNMWI